MQGAIVFSGRTQIRDIIRTTCAEIGIKQFEFTRDVSEAFENLKKFPNYLLVVDYEDNYQDLQTLLDKAREDNTFETRASLLIAKDVDKVSAAFCAEFGITIVHSGQLSVGSLAFYINEVKQETDRLGPIRGVLTKAIEIKKSGEIDQSIDLLESLVEKVPSNYHVKTELADLYIQKGNWETAKTILGRIKDEKPPNLRGLNLLARCYMQDGQFEEAADCFKMGKILNPYNVDRLIQLGECLLYENNLEEAEKNFEEASRLAPKNKEAIQGKGKVKLMGGDLNEALKLLRQISSDHELAAVFNTSAILSARHGSFEKALQLYEQALSALKESKNTIKARLFFNKGIGYKRWGKEEEALEAFEESVKLDSSFEKAKRNMHHTAKKTGIAISPELLSLMEKENSPSPKFQLEDSAIIDANEEKLADSLEPVPTAVSDQFETEIGEREFNDFDDLDFNFESQDDGDEF